MIINPTKSYKIDVDTKIFDSYKERFKKYKWTPKEPILWNTRTEEFDVFLKGKKDYAEESPVMKSFIMLKDLPQQDSYFLIPLAILSRDTTRKWQIDLKEWKTRNDSVKHNLKLQYANENSPAIYRHPQKVITLADKYLLNNKGIDTDTKAINQDHLLNNLIPYLTMSNATFTDEDNHPILVYEFDKTIFDEKDEKQFQAHFHQLWKWLVEQEQISEEVFSVIKSPHFVALDGIVKDDTGFRMYLRDDELKKQGKPIKYGGNYYQYNWEKSELERFERYKEHHQKMQTDPLYIYRRNILNDNKIKKLTNLKKTTLSELANSKSGIMLNPSLYMIHNLDDIITPDYNQHLYDLKEFPNALWNQEQRWLKVYNNIVINDYIASEELQQNIFKAILKAEEEEK